MHTTREPGENGKNKVSIISIIIIIINDIIIIFEREKVLRRSLVARTLRVGEEYVLTSVDPDNSKEMRDWVDILKSLVCFLSFILHIVSSLFLLFINVSVF